MAHYDADQIQREEEIIRELVRQLPDAQRKRFFEETEKALKDPDTYAVLNYLFIAGLHHFYLEKWQQGTINVVVFVAGIGLMLSGLFKFGLALIIGISLFELPQLFRSQLIVEDYNNRLMRRIYQAITGLPAPARS